MDDLTQDELNRLYELVFEREYNPKHQDDYGNAGGFYGHWEWYSDEERAELLAKAKEVHYE